MMLLFLIRTKLCPQNDFVLRKRGQIQFMIDILKKNQVSGKYSIELFFFDYLFKKLFLIHFYINTMHLKVILYKC